MNSSRPMAGVHARRRCSVPDALCFFGVLCHGLLSRGGARGTEGKGTAPHGRRKQGKMARGAPSGPTEAEETAPVPAGPSAGPAGTGVWPLQHSVSDTSEEEQVAPGHQSGDPLLQRKAQKI